MKLIIDIDEEEYKWLDYCQSLNQPIVKAIKSGTVLPDNPTNGNMIKFIFPNASITEIGGDSTIVVANDYKFNSTWWNAPYERGKG